MPISNRARRASYLFLCIVPFLDFIVVGMRALRIPGVYQSFGGALFAAIVVAAWLLGARMVVIGAGLQRTFATVGTLLIMPWALISLLWVGLATPWDATAVENEMRYAVLLAGSIAITVGFVLLREALNESGEHFYSTLGFAANILAGPAYLTWTSFQLGIFAAKVGTGQVSAAIISVANVFDTILFAAGVLTYLATAAFAVSLGQTRWLGRRAAQVFVTINVIAVIFLLMRGVAFPDPTAAATPWYTRPGFIVGIPALPWIVPFLFGVLLLRRAGDEQSAEV